jgi:hypothetical protein
MAEEAFVQDLCMFPSARQPGDDGGLTIAEDPRGFGRIQPFGQSREHQGDLLRGGFQTIQGRVEPRSERGTASRTSKRLDAFGLAMLAISLKTMNGSVCDAEVRTLPVGTGEAVGLYPLGGSPSAFHLRPRTYGQRRWPTTQRGSGGETIGGAAADGGVWYAWPLLVNGKAEDATSQDTKAAPEKEGGRPRAGMRTHEDP